MSRDSVEVFCLKEIRRDAAEEVRSRCRAQDRLWRKVPLLALEADGRTGHSGQYSRAYREGLWAINGALEDGWYTLFVDLGTGELVGMPMKEGDLRPAAEHTVLRALSKPEELDAHAVVERLERAGEQPVGSYYDADEKDRWRSALREELGLDEEYSRERGPLGVNWAADLI